MGRVVPGNGVRENSAYSRRDPAGEFDITTRAIRFYEEKVSLSSSHKGTRRIYSSTDRAALRLILRGKRLGLSLDDSREINDLQGVEDRRCSTSANRTKMPEPKMACHAADFPAVYLTFVSPGAKIL